MNRSNRLYRGAAVPAAAAMAALAAVVVGGLSWETGHELSTSARRHVAPWDDDDIRVAASKASAGPLIGIPKRLVYAKDGVAQLGDLRIALQAIARPDPPFPRTSKWVNERAWSPDGGPHPVEWAAWSNRRTDPEPPPHTGERILRFTIDSPTTESIGVYGYVPESARTLADGTAGPGCDSRHDEEVGPQAPHQVYAQVAVESTAAHKYRLAIADGTWTEVASLSSLPAKPDDRVLMKGGWGSLLMAVPKLDRARSGGIMTSSMPMPEVTFTVEPRSEPAEFCYRIQFLDSSGKQLNSGVLRDSGRQAIWPEFRFGSIKRVVVSARPYTYIEFGGIRYDPDPSLWEYAHWGKQGEDVVARGSGPAVVEGIFKPAIQLSPQQGAGVEPAAFFAPDGVPWHEFQTTALDLYGPPDSGSTAAAEYGLLRLDTSLGAPMRTVRAEAFPATSSVPGQGLVLSAAPRYVPTQIPSASFLPFSTEIAVPFDRPAKERYVQFKVRVSDAEWHVVGSLKPPAPPYEKYTPEEMASVNNGAMDVKDDLILMVESTGLWKLWTPGHGGSGDSQELSGHWDASNSETRLVAKMKSGERLLLQANGWTANRSDYGFRLDKAGIPVMVQQMQPTQNGTSWGPKTVALPDVESFELQTRDFGAPFYLVAKVPPSR